ncbi:hypothetical protein [Plantibacter sp. ME-Dv--P-122b]|uniref:hypothetical protein n=1 Tax=Plantibacter sp. ME-Dv--P-122b TaxID=3040300 RepID=UPI00254FCFC7|nr:hypothetical protein [Plantibacter sp. ME-Dv--P-122b]
MTLLDAPPESFEPSPNALDACLHAWATESAHTTSEGSLRYLRCIACGSRRVELRPYDDAPTVPVSRRDIPPR